APPTPPVGFKPVGIETVCSLELESPDQRRECGQATEQQSRVSREPGAFRDVELVARAERQIDEPGRGRDRRGDAVAIADELHRAVPALWRNAAGQSNRVADAHRRVDGEEARVANGTIH